MKHSFLMAGTLAAVLLAAPADAQDKIQLRVFSIFDAQLSEKWAPVEAAYEEANPNIDVVIENTAGSGAAVYPDVLRTSMASGDPPDVFFLWGGTISGPFVKAGQVRPLDDFYEKYGWKSLGAAVDSGSRHCGRQTLWCSFPRPRHGFLVSHRYHEGEWPQRAEDVCRVRRGLRQAEECGQILRLGRRKIWLAPDASRRLFS